MPARAPRGAYANFPRCLHAARRLFHPLHAPGCPWWQHAACQLPELQPTRSWSRWLFLKRALRAVSQLNSSVPLPRADSMAIDTKDGTPATIEVDCRHCQPPARCRRAAKRTTTCLGAGGQRSHVTHSNRSYTYDLGIGNSAQMTVATRVGVVAGGGMKDWMRFLNAAGGEKARCGSSKYIIIMCRNAIRTNCLPKAGMGPSKQVPKCVARSRAGHLGTDVVS